MSSIEPNDGGGEVDGGEKVARSFVVAGCDGAILLKLGEEVFDQVPHNIVEQDLRAIKRLVRPMLGFKSFRSAAVTLAGVELMHMIRKGQLLPASELCPAHQFYSLAG